MMIILQMSDPGAAGRFVCVRGPGTTACQRQGRRAADGAPGGAWNPPWGWYGLIRHVAPRPEAEAAH